MNLPLNTFKKAVADTFADKQLTVYDSEIVKSNKGFTREVLSEQLGTFKGNAQTGYNKELAEEYGIKSEFELSVTTSDTDSDIVNLGSILGFLGRYFRVTDLREFDSHKLIVAEKWLSKSSGSPSA